jgi:hypothetical protein
MRTTTRTICSGACSPACSTPALGCLPLPACAALLSVRESLSALHSLLPLLPSCSCCRSMLLYVLICVLIVPVPPSCTMLGAPDDDLKLSGALCGCGWLECNQQGAGLALACTSSACCCCCCCCC